MSADRGETAPNDMRVVLSGASGFLGSHMADRLLAAGARVVGVDSLLTGTTSNLAHLQSHPGFRLVIQDVSAPSNADFDDALAWLRDDGPLTGVLHLASPASPVDYLRHPLETLAVGSEGTRRMLDLCTGGGTPARFLLASTSEVYGDPQVHPQPESYWGHVNSVGPRAVYDEAKRFAEALTSAYWRIGAVDVRIARIFNTYGPRMRPDDGRVVSNFIVQALRGESLTLYGRGEQTRSFCYVTDEIEGLFRLFAAPQLPPAHEAYSTDGRDDLPPVVNVGNPNEFTVAELAELVRNLVAARSGRAPVPLTYLPMPADDPKVRRPEATRAESWLGWRPVVSLAEGVEHTLEYFADRLGVALTPADSVPAASSAASSAAARA